MTQQIRPPNVPANWSSSPPPAPKKRSRIVPALITIFCALLLTGGAGFGYLATCGGMGGHTGALNPPFLVGTAAGALLLVVAVLWLLAEIVLVIIRAGKGDL
jgi:hypothetical protein